MEWLDIASGGALIALLAIILIAFPAEFIRVSNAGLKPNSWWRVKLDVAGTRAMGIGLLVLDVFVIIVALIE